MAFRFRMEKLLRLKRLAEEESIRRLGQKMQSEQECLCRVRAIEDGRDELARELQRPLRGEELALVLSLLDLFSRELARALEELSRLRQEVAQRRAEATRRVCDRQAFERIEDEDRDRYRKEQRQAERRRMDEVARGPALGALRIAEAEHE